MLTAGLGIEIKIPPSIWNQGADKSILATTTGAGYIIPNTKSTSFQFEWKSKLIKYY